MGPVRGERMTSDAGEGILFIADPHLSPGGGRLEAFRSFLEKTRGKAGSLVILGDLFDLWLASDRLMEEYHREVIGKLIEFRDGGTETVYVAGNRDFILDSKYKRCFTCFIDGAYEREWHGLRIHAVHGDLVNRKDYQYRFWRRFSRNPVATGVFRMIPRGIGLNLAKKLEVSMRGSNLDQKSRFPVEECEGYARRLFESGYDYVLMGHFHTEHTWFPTKEKKLFSLPDWGTTRKALLITDEKAVLAPV